MIQHVYGPIPSRRLGKSLGISPIPKKTCNYGCIYCMLDQTDNMINTPQAFYEVDDILNQIQEVVNQGIDFDVVTLAGEGEPTLYANLTALFTGIKKITTKPIAVITNGATLDRKEVYDALLMVDIVLPSVNSYNLETFKRINRPHKDIDFKRITQALVEFSHEFKGQCWLELMLMEDINDSVDDLQSYREFFKQFRYDRLYINTPVRPPTEKYATKISHQKMLEAMELLGGIGIEDVYSNGYYSSISDSYQAILNIISSHPMHQYEITHFLKSRNCDDIQSIFNRLNNDPQVNVIKYRGYHNYRLKRHRAQ